MKTEGIQALAAQTAKNIRSEKDLNESKQLFTKMTLETSLNAELDQHLGYDKHEQSTTKIAVTVTLPKRCKQKKDQFELKTPCDHNSDYESKIVKKKQRRFISMSDKIFFLYAQDSNNA